MSLRSSRLARPSGRAGTDEPHADRSSVVKSALNRPPTMLPADDPTITSAEFGFHPRS
jgi:hypothetical protein